MKRNRHVIAVVAAISLTYAGLGVWTEVDPVFWAVL